MLFHLFRYNDYYPGGGLCDYVASYPTLAAAKAAGNALPGDNVDIAFVGSDGRLHLGWCATGDRAEWDPCEKNLELLPESMKEFL